MNYKEAQKARAKQLQNCIDDIISGKRNAPVSPKQITDKAAKDAKNKSNLKACERELAEQESYVTNEDQKSKP